MNEIEVNERDIHVGFSGTQKGMTNEQKRVLESVLSGIAPGWFHHGWCIGADAEADAIARKVGFKIIGHPPLKTIKMAQDLPEPTIMNDPFEYMARNTHITLASGILIATPKGFKEEKAFSGTWATIRRGMDHCMFVLIIYPDGSMQVDFND